ncbi:MAG: c-type cytochrome domain-containing protein, partial [Pirellula sp.]
MTLRLISSNSLGAACLVIAIFLGSMSSAQSQIYYEDSVAPILRKNCIACHNVKLAEGGLNLESPVTAAKGGDSGPAINKTEVAKSSILERASSTDEEMMMPPKGNTVGAERLTEAQLKIIKEWIAGGALSRGTIGNMSLASNLKLPESARATYALAVSPDTDFVAFGRGGQLVIHNARRLAASQSADGVLEPTPVQIIKDAHQDFIHSIAISHDGQRIATGSTGQVKIWKQTNQSVDSIRKNLEQVNVPVSHLFCTSADGSLLATLKKRAVPKDAAPNSLIPGVMTMLNREGEIVYAIDVPNAMLACATWSPSNHRFFTVGVNRILYAWDLNSSPIQAPVQTQLSSDIQWVVAIDETTLLFGSDRKSFVWQYKSPTTAELVADHPLASALNAAGPIDLVSVSLDRTKLVVGTHDEKLETTNLKLWSVPQAKLVGSFERDRRTSLEYQLADRVLSRAQSAVDRSKANVTELEKALQAEETAVKTAQTNKEKSAEAATKKEQERLAAVQAMADHDKQMTETQAAIDAATKKLETLKTELEPKKKAVADLEKQKSEAQTAMENATQSLAATEDSKKAAQSRLEAKKLAVVQQTEELTKVQETSTKLKTIADSVKFSAMAIAFVNENTVATISKTKNESSPPSMVDLFTL